MKTKFRAVIAALLIAATVVAVSAQTRINGVYTDLRSAIFTLASFNGATLAQIKAGSADPEASVSAPPGSIYLRTDGTIYKKSTGSGNTGWEDIGTGGGGSGDIEAVVAGAGLTDGGTTGSVTLNVGAGYALDVAADAVALDLTEIVGSVTIGDGSTDTIVLTFDRATGTDTTLTMNSGSLGVQALTSAGAITSTTLDTGQGANELYDMDQNVLTTSAVVFTTVTVDADVLDSSWNGVQQAAPKDAIWDYLQTFVTITDPDVDALLFWDDSAGTVVPITSMVGCSITTTVLTCTGSTSTWDGIGDSTADGTIALGAHETDWTSTIDASGEVIWTVTNTDAALANAVAALALQFNDDAGAEMVWLKFVSDADGTPASNFLVRGTANVGSAQILLGATGVSITDDDDGAITFASLSTGSGGVEDLTFNLDDVANTVGLSSSTGVTSLNFGGIAVRNAGLKGTLQLILGVCQGSTASLGMNIQASGAATVSCAGSTIIHAVTTFPDSGTSEVQFQFRIPDDWDGAAMELRSQWRTSATANDAIFQISGVCGADAEVIPTAYSSTPNTVTETAKGTTLQMNDFSITMSVAANNSLATCSPGETFYGRFFRDPSGSDNLATDVTITAPLTFYYGKL